ncbi:hypothetical protein NX774_17315 [Massilia agilis]|uniref:Uncharacterized protein n=1 Tax=Massilia agilis TaxID=1811226 RepID=A0ABT2DER2_9BURK|nr:hypothetical protein [Massilia agilis]
MDPQRQHRQSRAGRGHRGRRRARRAGRLQHRWRQGRGGRGDRRCAGRRLARPADRAVGQHQARHRDHGAPGHGRTGGDHANSRRAVPAGRACAPAEQRDDDPRVALSAAAASRCGAAWRRVSRVGTRCPPTGLSVGRDHLCCTHPLPRPAVEAASHIHANKKLRKHVYFRDAFFRALCHRLHHLGLHFLGHHP